MWLGQTVSVIFPTYNEKDSIRAAVDDFLATGVVDEVIVVNNNAAPGTSEEVAKTKAREVIESRQGYGAAIRRGLKEATGDLLIVAEPDGTFAGRDVHKLLAYAADFDVIYGSRTVNDFIWEGANMGLFLRWGNWAVAKMMEVLFNATSLTDVGCTMRLLKRSAYQTLEPYFTVDGNFFGPEMMLLSLHSRLKVVQIPVNYLPRVGESSVTGSFRKAFLLGMRMIALIVEHRLKRFVGWKPGDLPADVGNISAGMAAFGQALLVLLFVLACGAQLGTPLVIDEMDFPSLARAIAHTGKPFYYRGEALPHYAGIYHIPLYGYALGGWLWIFGDSIVAVRAFSMVTALVAWALGLRILAQVCRAMGVRFQAPALFYSLLLLTSPYFIQNALLPDIDGTTLIVAWLGTITLMLDWVRKPNWKHALWCGVALGVSLLSKMTTTLGLLVLLPVAAWYSAPVGGRRRWEQAAAIPIVGVAMLFGIWGLVASALSVDFWYPFKFTFQSANKATVGTDRLAAALQNLEYNKRQLRWLGHGLTALLAAGLGGAVVLAWRRASARAQLLVLALGTAFVFTVYAFIIGPVFTFSKYYVVAMPLAAALAAVVMVAGRVLRPSRNEVIGLGALSLLALVWMVLVEKDTRLLPGGPSTFLMASRVSLFVAAAIVLGGIALLWRARVEGRISAPAAFLLPLAILAVAQGAGTAVAHARAPYSTRYYYGERGMDELAAFLRSELAPGEPVFAAKDVGIAAERPFYEDAIYFPDRESLDQTLAARRPRLIVVRKKFDYSFQVYPHAEGVMQARGYRPWREFDDFVVWKNEEQAVQ